MEKLNIETRLEMRLSPLLIQSLNLLQLPQLELAEIIEQNLEQNPFLEKEDIQPQNEIPIPKDYDEWGNYPKDVNYRDDEEYTPPVIVQETTFEEYMLEQINLVFKHEEELTIGKHIIFSLNEEGYLTESVEEIADFLKKDIETVKRVLKKIQFLDPVGVATKDMRECLLVQLEDIGLENSLAYKIVSEALDEFLKKDFVKIKKLFKIKDKELQEVEEIIMFLAPVPRKAWGGGQAKYVVPDIVIEEENSKWRVYLNDSYIPHITLSKVYREFMSNPRKFSEEELSYLRKKWNDAHALLSGIEKRRETLLSIGEYIVKKEEDFLRKGTFYLNLLTLNEVADGIGRNVSTVSRAIRGKYVQTPIGVLPLNKFFSKGTKRTWNRIERRIKELIENEDKKNPLSDHEIMTILGNEELKLARTTVVKYRKILGIPSSNERIQPEV